MVIKKVVKKKAEGRCDRTSPDDTSQTGTPTSRETTSSRPSSVVRSDSQSTVPWHAEGGGMPQHTDRRDLDDYYTGGVSQWREYEESKWDDWDWPPYGWAPSEYHNAYWDPSSYYHQYKYKDWDQRRTHSQPGTPLSVRSSHTDELAWAQSVLRANSAELRNLDSFDEPKDPSHVNASPQVAVAPQQPQPAPVGDPSAQCNAPKANTPSHDAPPQGLNKTDQPEKPPDIPAESRETQAQADTSGARSNAAGSQSMDPTDQEKKTADVGNGEHKDKGEKTEAEKKTDEEINKMSEKKKKAHARYMRYWRNIRSVELRAGIILTFGFAK